MKKVVSSSIITLFIILAVAVTFMYVQNFRSKGGDPVQAIPVDAAFFMVYDPSAFNSEKIMEPGYWSLLRKTPAFSSFENNLQLFDSLISSNDNFSRFVSSSPLYISAHVTGAKDFDFLFLKSVDADFNDDVIDQLFVNIIKQGSFVNKRNYDGNLIREVVFEGKTIFSFSMSKGMFLLSTTTFIVEDALRQIKVGKPVLSDFKKFSAESNSTGFDLYINFRNLPSFLGVFMDPSKQNGLTPLKTFSNWAASGLTFSSTSIHLNGSLSLSDTSFFQSCFIGQNPIDKNLLQILPRKTAVISYTGLSDNNLFYQKYTANYITASQKSKKDKLVQTINEAYGLNIEEMMRSWMGNEHALVITEPSGVNYDNSCYAVFKSRNNKETTLILEEISKAIDSKGNHNTLGEIYNDYTIKLIRLNNILPVLFGDMFNRITKMYYTQIGDYVVFANQPSALRSFIDDYRTGSLLVETDFFQSIQKQIPQKGNYFFYFRPVSSVYIFKSAASDLWSSYADTYREQFSGISGVCFQLNAGSTWHRFNSIISFSNGGRQKGVSRMFSVETDSSVRTKPLLTTDPVSNTRQIVFQDELRNVYMVENTGKVLWKEQIGGNIMGDIFEIDLFKNGSRQFLFNTSDYLYLLDPQGKPIGNYPIRLPAPATTGIAVIDFDNRNDPRIYVACENNRIYAYLPSGKPLPGWNFRQVTAVVSRTPWHVKIHGKDYLVINDSDGSVFIVNRFGENAIQVNDKFVIAKNSTIYQRDDGTLVTTDHFGNIKTILPGGQVETIPLNAAGSEHGFIMADADADGDEDFIFAEKNELIAYNSNLVLIYRKEFEYQLTGDIRLITLKNGEKAMALRSEVSDKTWLVKLNGSDVFGFPIKGSGPAVIDELNLDGNKSLFLGSGDRFFYVYSVD